MTQATPGWGNPQAPAPPPAGGPGGASRRGPLIAILAGLAVFLVSGVGAFALSGGFGGRVGQSVECGGINRCIPSLSRGAVIDALTAEGYVCEAPGQPHRHFCHTQIGAHLYETQVAGSLDDPERIESVLSNVAYPDESPPSGATKSYFAWFASLPFGDDQVTVDEVTTWVTQRIDGGEDEVVVIGGYQLGVKASEPGRIELSVRGV